MRIADTIWIEAFCHLTLKELLFSLLLLDSLLEARSVGLLFCSCLERSHVEGASHLVRVYVLNVRSQLFLCSCTLCYKWAVHTVVDKLDFLDSFLKGICGIILSLLLNKVPREFSCASDFDLIWIVKVWLDHLSLTRLFSRRPITRSRRVSLRFDDFGCWHSGILRNALPHRITIDCYRVKQGTGSVVRLSDDFSTCLCALLLRYKLSIPDPLFWLLFSARHAHSIWDVSFDHAWIVRIFSVGRKLLMNDFLLLLFENVNRLTLILAIISILDFMVKGSTLATQHTSAQFWVALPHLPIEATLLLTRFRLEREWWVSGIWGKPFTIFGLDHFLVLSVSADIERMMVRRSVTLFIQLPITCWWDNLRLWAATACIVGRILVIKQVLASLQPFLFRVALWFCGVKILLRLLGPSRLLISGSIWWVISKLLEQRCSVYMLRFLFLNPDLLIGYRLLCALRVAEIGIYLMVIELAILSYVSIKRHRLDSFIARVLRCLMLLKRGKVADNSKHTRPNLIGVKTWAQGVLNRKQLLFLIHAICMGW